NGCRERLIEVESLGLIESNNNVTDPFTVVFPAVRALCLRCSWQQRADHRQTRHQYCAGYADTVLWLRHRPMSCPQCGRLPRNSPHLTQHRTAPCCCLCPELRQLTSLCGLSIVVSSGA